MNQYIVTKLRCRQTCVFKQSWGNTGFEGVKKIFNVKNCTYLVLSSRMMFDL